MNDSEEYETEKIEGVDIDKYSDKLKTIAMIFYIAVVVSCVITIAGIVYTIADLIMSEGKLTLFLSLNFGYQIAIVGGLFAGLFFILIFFFGLYKKGITAILKFMFKKVELEDKYKHRIDVQIAAGGLLLSVMAIIVGLAISLFYELLVGSSDTDTPTISNLISLFSQGQILLFISIIVFSFVGLSIFLVYLWNNGYYIILKFVGGLEDSGKKRKSK